jgi:small subunit ribosomal protein S11
MLGLLTTARCTSGTRAFSTAARLCQTVPSFHNVQFKQREPTNVLSPQSSNTQSSSSASASSSIKESVRSYTLYCNFTKNNTHLTLTAATEDLHFIEKNPQLSFTEQVLYYYQLPQLVKISLSTGQLGFRKSARGEYEAAFQTSAKMFALMKERGFLDNQVQLVVKNFGKGREAFFDALKGKEGTEIRNKITRLSDNTKLKFGGTRSPSIRRL